MTTTSFLLATLVVFAIQEIVMRLGWSAAQKGAANRLEDFLLDANEKRSLQFLPPISNAIFALLFAFLIFQFGDLSGEISLWNGLLYGLAIGVFVYWTQSLVLIATLANVREFFVRCAVFGVIASGMSGIAVSFIL